MFFWVMLVSGDDVGRWWLMVGVMVEGCGDGWWRWMVVMGGGGD